MTAGRNLRNDNKCDVNILEDARFLAHFRIGVKTSDGEHYI